MAYRMQGSYGKKCFSGMRIAESDRGLVPWNEPRYIMAESNAPVRQEENADNRHDPMVAFIKAAPSDADEWIQKNGKFLGINVFNLPVVGRMAGEAAFELRKRYRRILRLAGKR